MNIRDLNKDRVLLTGVGGVLGAALFKALNKRGVKSICAPTRSDCDLLKWDSVIGLCQEFRPTLIFHLAAWVSGLGGNLKFSAQAFYENAQININIIEAARRTGVEKFVAAGTTAVYSDEVPLPLSEKHIWVGVPHSSERAYGHAKRAMLAQLEACQLQSGLDYGYLLCTNLYGPHDRFDEVHGHVIPSLISRFYRAKQSGQKEIIVWGDGTPTRDFLYSEDAAEAFLTIAEKGHGPYNVATGSHVTIREMVDTLKTVCGFDGDIVWDTSKPNGQQARSYDISLLSALGWRQQISLDAGLAETFAWYGQHVETARR